jgi:hypothetical protein
MHDTIMTSFLRHQHEDAAALTRDSDLVEISAHGSPADRFLVRFTCRGLVRSADGTVSEASEFFVGITFHEDYLRLHAPWRSVTWLAPHNVWHPNIAPGPQLICIGRMGPGTGLIDLVQQCFDIITWNKVTMREDDALNHAACEWARGNRSRFPVDPRPIKRRALAIEARDISPGDQRASA